MQSRGKEHYFFLFGNQIKIEFDFTMPVEATNLVLSGEKTCSTVTLLNPTPHLSFEAPKNKASDEAGVPLKSLPHEL